MGAIDPEIQASIDTAIDAQIKIVSASYEQQKAYTNLISVFGGAIAGSISTSFGLRNFVSSSRPCPSGARIITMSTWTLSSPLMRSTHGPSTGVSPSIVMPSAVKKAIAAARSSTTTLTWSNLLIVMSQV